MPETKSPDTSAPITTPTLKSKLDNSGKPDGRKWACCRTERMSDTGRKTPGAHTHGDSTELQKGSRADGGRSIQETFCPDGSETKSVRKRMESLGWSLEEHRKVCYRHHP